MIFDNIKNYELYTSLNKGFEKAFKFLKRAEAENLDVGKYEIDGDKVYAMVQEYNTKFYEEGKFEGHKKYIDIQYIISGSEIIEVADVSKVTPNTEYDEQKDFMLFENTEDASTLILNKGDYAILFPHDIHKPGLAVNNTSSTVKKVVVKVKN